MQELYTVNKDLVFKGLFTAVFVSDYGEGEIPDELFDEDGNLNPLPTGWYPVGYTGEDGTTHSRDRDVTETMAAQEASAIRDDVNTDTQTAQVILLETSPVAIALYEGLTFDKLGTDLGTPLTWAKPATPPIIQRHWLFVAVDLSKKTGAEKIRARLFPSGAVSEVGDQVENRGEVLGYEITVKAYRDPEYNTDVLNWLDGPGWRELAPDPGP